MLKVLVLSSAALFALTGSSKPGPTELPQEVQISQLKSENEALRAYVKQLVHEKREAVVSLFSISHAYEQTFPKEVILLRVEDARKSLGKELAKTDNADGLRALQNICKEAHTEGFSVCVAAAELLLKR